ncbi:MAG: hypothetical protein AAF943_12770 [Pseudomonadota bacterium]
MAMDLQNGGGQIGAHLQTGEDADTAMVRAIRAVIDTPSDADKRPDVRRALNIEKPGNAAERLKAAAPLAEVIPTERPKIASPMVAPAPLSSRGRLVAYALCVAFLLCLGLRPLLLVSFLILGLGIWVALGALLGKDALYDGVKRLSGLAAKRFPKLASDVQCCYVMVAHRWGRFLDLMPSGTVDAFYLPQLGAREQAERSHSAALDRRFAALRDPEF